MIPQAIRALFFFNRKQDLDRILRGFHKTLRDLDSHVKTCGELWDKNRDAIDRLTDANKDLDVEIARTLTVRDRIEKLIKE